MSYDIGVHDGAGRFYHHTESYTSNVEPMWTLALGRPLKELDGMTCEDAVPLLEKAKHDMIYHHDKYVALNPPNGWGDAKGATEIIMNLLYICMDHPHFKIHVAS